MLNEPEELTFHQVDPTFIDVSYYEYMLQDVRKTCREMDISCEIHRQKSWFIMHDIKICNSKLISRVYQNENKEEKIIDMNKMFIQQTQIKFYSNFCGITCGRSVQFIQLLIVVLYL